MGKIVVSCAEWAVHRVIPRCCGFTLRGFANSRSHPNNKTEKNDLNSLIKRDQLDVTCFIILLFNAQHVSDVNTSILKSLRLMCWVISLVVLLWFDVCWCYVVVWLGWCGIRMQAQALKCFSLHKDTTPPQPNHNVTPTHIEPEQYNPWNNTKISRKLLRMDVLTSETCWALNNEVIKQVTSSWSLFIELSRWCTVQ